MPLSGELIRMMNYVDDISATLRRIVASTPMMTDEERKKLSDYMRKSEPNYAQIFESLEKAK